MDDLDQEWTEKGATLSDKTARKELGLTEEEIVAAMRAGKLQFRIGSMHGNPWYRLLRREVEALVVQSHGKRYLEERKATAELARVNAELKRLRSELVIAEQRRTELVALLAHRPGDP